MRFLGIDQGTEAWIDVLVSIFATAPEPRLAPATKSGSAASPSSDPATEQAIPPDPSSAFPRQNKGNRLDFNQQVLQAGYDIAQNASLLSNLYRKGQFTA